MNSSLTIPTLDGASRLTSASEGRQLKLAAKALAIPIFFTGFESLCQVGILARQHQCCQR